MGERETVLVQVTNQEIQQNKDFVIYNHLRSYGRNCFTKEQFQQDLKEKYNLILSDKEVDKCFLEAVRSGDLRQLFLCYSLSSLPIYPESEK
jgi:hypothetical protein